MAVKYLAGNRLIGTAAERTGMTEIFAPKTSWKQIAKTTLGSGGDTAVEVTSIPQRDNLMILWHIPSGNSNSWLSAGINDGSASSSTDTSGVNSYIGERGTNESLSSGTSHAKILLCDMNRGSGGFYVIRIKNVSDRQKFVISNGTERSANASVSTTWDYPMTQEFVGKVNRTDGYIDRLRIDSNSGTGEGTHTFPEGTEMVVLGCNDDEADNSTPNAPFWQQITEKELTASGTLDSGASSIPNKKYLMIEVFYEDGGSSQTANVTFNNDSGSNYTWRISGGGDYSTSLGQTSLTGFGSSQTGDKHGTMFMENISGLAKIGIVITEQQSDAGSAGPKKNGAWKYVPDTLTDLLTRIAFSGTAGSGSTIRIWGGTPT